MDGVPGDQTIKLVRHDVTASPDRGGFRRVSVDVRTATAMSPLQFWFDVPESHADRLTGSGNPWLLMMLPLAMASGQAIEMPCPVDPHLVDNLNGLMQVWHAWSPRMTPVAIRAPRMKEAVASAGRRALFYSGGIDSSFSLLRHVDGTTGDGGGPVDDLIHIAGFDLPLTATAELETAQRVTEDVARRFDKKMVRVFTNLRTPTSPYRSNWIGTYACALAAVGHLLEGEYSELLIAAAYDFGHPDPRIGSHPMTDPLLGSRSLRVVHDGGSFTRVEKTARVAQSDAALTALRVCWESRKFSNCSECRKCLITMVTLDLLGYKDKARSFDWSAYDVQSLRRLRLTTESQRVFFLGIVTAARSAGRADIVEAVSECVRTYDRQRRIEPFLRRFNINRNVLGRTRLWSRIRNKAVALPIKRVAERWI